MKLAGNTRAAHTDSLSARVIRTRRAARNAMVRMVCLADRTHNQQLLRPMSRTLRTLPPGRTKGCVALHREAARNHRELYREHSRKGIAEGRLDSYGDLHELPHRSPCPSPHGSG